jgi:hypothetical protein
MVKMKGKGRSEGSEEGGRNERMRGWRERRRESREKEMEVGMRKWG